MLPLTKEGLEQLLDRMNISSLTQATIRQVVAVTAAAEKEAGEPFVHLEVGNPGLPPNAVGIEAECEALRNGLAGQYPPIMGCAQLKEAGSRFVKAFLDVDVAAGHIVPSVGSMQGSFCLMLLLSMCDPARDTILYLDPGFPPQHLQARLVGLRQESFDIYSHRGDALEQKLEQVLSSGHIAAMLYSNPNNPAWTNFSRRELEIIGRLATRHDVMVIEDLAYMGMDFRTDCGTPGQAPFVPSVAKYTDNYVLLISGSKIFSYAGQRVALVCMSDSVFERRDPVLENYLAIKGLGNAYIFGVVYAVSSGVSHSAQIAMAAMLDAAAEGRINFVADCREYQRRCAQAKKVFADAGFSLVYSQDDGVPVSDGFFFTVTYGNMGSEELQRALMRHGISTISLPGTGSSRHGLRICVSRLATAADINTLAKRLKAFADEERL